MINYAIVAPNILAVGQGILGWALGKKALKVVQIATNVVFESKISL